VTRGCGLYPKTKWEKETPHKRKKERSRSSKSGIRRGGEAGKDIAVRFGEGHFGGGCYVQKKKTSPTLEKESSFSKKLGEGVKGRPRDRLKRPPHPTTFQKI